MNETKTKPPGRIKSSVLKWLGVPISLTDGSFWSSWNGSSNWTGERVSVDSALQLSTAWACVRLISETLSTLPVNLYREEDGAKVVARDHNLYRLLHTQPNADMTAAAFWQAFVASMLLHGAAYVEKRESGGVITSLDFLIPELVTCRRFDSGAVEWTYNDPVTNRVRTIPESRMWHTPSFSLDGFNGLSAIQYGANVFGGAIAADKASANTFTGGMKASGLVTMDARLQPEQREDIRQHVKKVSDTGGVMVLERGSGFQQLSMNPQDAELLSTRSFNVEEICRWFRLDPSLVGHGGKDSNWGTGLEQKMIWLVTLALRPLAVRIEQSARKSLLKPAERSDHNMEFALEGLLRGDTSARAAFYSSMTQNGIMTRDECRRLENLPAMGGNAEVLTVQSNMLPVDKLGEAQPGTNAQDALKAWLGLEEKTNET